MGTDKTSLQNDGNSNQRLFTTKSENNIKQTSRNSTTIARRSHIRGNRKKNRSKENNSGSSNHRSRSTTKRRSPHSRRRGEQIRTREMTQQSHRTTTDSLHTPLSRSSSTTSAITVKKNDVRRNNR